MQPIASELKPSICRRSLIQLGANLAPTPPTQNGQSPAPAHRPSLYRRSLIRLQGDTHAQDAL